MLSKNPYFQNMGIVWKHAEGHRGTLIFYYILFVLGNVVYMLQPLFLGLFFNAVQEGGEQMFHNIILWLSLFSLCTFVQWCFHGPARIIERSMAYRVQEHFMLEWYQKLMSLPLKWHKDNHSGEIVSRVDKASSGLNSFVQEGFMYIEVISQFIIGAIALSTINMVISGYAIVMTVITISLVFFFDKFLIRSRHNLNNKEHKVNSMLFDYITNAVTVLILRLSQRTHQSIAERYSNIYPALTKHAKTQEWKWFTVSMMVMFTSFTALLYYCWSTLNAGNVILIGTLVTLYQYLDRFMIKFYDFTWHYGQIVRYSTDMMSLKDYDADYKRLVSKQKKLPTLKNWNTITLDTLGFSHEDQEKHLHTLKDISITLERGKNYAFVGESGSGKSTLLTILRGIEEFDSGKIIIDDTPFKTSRILAPLSSLCPQEPEIFENTMEYNIAAGVKHTKKEIEKMMDLARFSKVCKRLPKGLKTNIKEKGVNLSGGERQRLALARGLFAAKNSSLLLLDEPTSSVDPQNERNIYEDILKEYPDKTIISAIHRLHLLPLFDHVFVFDHGVLIEQGSFTELKNKKKGILTELWKNYQDNTTE